MLASAPVAGLHNVYIGHLLVSWSVLIAPLSSVSCLLLLRPPCCRAWPAPFSCLWRASHARLPTRLLFIMEPLSPLSLSPTVSSFSIGRTGLPTVSVSLLGDGSDTADDGLSDVDAPLSRSALLDL